MDMASYLPYIYMPEVPQNEDMEPVEDEQKHRLHNDNAETEAPALQDERE